MSTLTCPKSMTYGPCGGVEADGRCEVASHRCVFLDVETVRWGGPPPAAIPPAPLRAALETGRLVVADLPAAAVSVASIAGVAAVLRGTVDAVLAGDSGRERVQFPPAYRARLLHEAGLEVWTGINCRDRNRVAIEGELAALAHERTGAVHCVTGDHPNVGSRPDAAPVFDLDSTELAALARAAGHLVSVGESPATPPTARRSARLLEKQRAGAEVCFVNHAGGVEPVRRFIAEARDLGVTLRFVACVPVVVDAGSAALLRSFTALALPAGYLDRVESATDARSAGIEASVALAQQLLELDGVDGVNLSGGSGAGGELAFAEALAEIAAGVNA